MMTNTVSNFPAFCVAGTGLGDGKTTVTLALLRALARRGKKVQPFKCGPDYIDPAFHNIASGQLSRNLDGWMMGTEQVKKSFAAASTGKDCAVVEGVMGLFDSSRPGTLEGSTAEISLIAGLPVVLVVNARGMAGSIAAMVKGYAEFHPELKVIGVIANKVGSDSHAKILKEALASAEMPPLLGYLKRNDKWILPERHLGLVPFTENKKTQEWFDALASEAEKYFEIDKILDLSRIIHPTIPEVEKSAKTGARLALARDKAFHFYYEDNLDMLRENGVELIEFSPLRDQSLPENIGGIYIGGGFPECFAGELESNQTMRKAIREFADRGGIVYAECGGFMYLAEKLIMDGQSYEMCGVVSAGIDMCKRLRSLGYREVKTSRDSFFGSAGTVMRGHEFHWSSETFTEKQHPAFHFRTATQNGYPGKCGYINNNVLASYIHLHWASIPQAPANFANALRPVPQA